MSKVLSLTEGRKLRDQRSDDIVIGLAREGVPSAAISRAMAVPLSQVTGAVMRGIGAGRLKSRPRLEWDDDDALRAARRRVNELEAEIEEWKQRALFASDHALDDADVSDIRGAFAFTPSEARLVALLMQQSRISYAALYQALYTARDRDTPQAEVIKVLISRVRSKFRGIGIDDVIRTHWGVGYSMQPAAAAEIRDRIKR